jgi:hypothetical protein
MAKNTEIFGADERLRRDPATAERASRDAADASRMDDGGSLSDAERRALIRQEWVTEVLPTPPELPGFHTCWLSTTNSADPIFKRMRQGYLPVKVVEVPGFAQYKITGGEFDGCVQCNEMLLFKIETTRYQDIMTILHHDMPAEAERSIYERMTVYEEERDSQGQPLVRVEEGTKQLGRTPPKAPTFS